MPMKGHRKSVAIILGQGPASRPDEAEEPAGGGAPIQSAASDLLQAIETKDAAGVAEALRAAFQILDAEPHEEGLHEGEE